MAGESPDRSKQHESSASSAEATSGTPAAVPGPVRSAAAGAADPRLAVARERAATVRVDQATAVFSTRTPAEPSAASGEKVSAGVGEKTSGGSGEKSPGGDARLRAVVAAWVSGVDEEEPQIPQEAGSGAAGAEEAGKPASAAEGAETAAEDPGTVDGDAGSAGGAADGASAEESADDNDAGSEDEAGAGAGGDDGGSAAATDRAVTDGAGADTYVDAGADVESEKDADPSDTEPVAADEETAADGTKTAEAGGDGGEAGTEPDADVHSGSDGASAAGGDRVEDAKPAGNADAKPDAKPAGKPGPEDSSEGSPKDSRDGSDGSDDSDGSDRSDRSEESAAAASPVASKPPVDQPTAVFKTPRRPAVDQPTTMLKLGDVRPGAKTDAKPATDKPAAGTPSDKPGPKPEPKTDAKPGSAPKPKSQPKAGAAAKAEAEAERTSRFVALRPLDEPAPAKPRPAPADATAALPQVGPERTTQQPLPPKPPLDLLAELTNTPPPPQTPVRTLVRRVKIWTPLALLLVVIFAIAQAVRPLPSATLALTADATYTFEGGTLDLPWPGKGQSAIEVQGVGSLGTDGKQTPAPIASVAKIMTAYVILQEHPLKGNEGGEKITVDQQAEDESKLPDESTAAMSKGQQFTERQMLQMLMIPSGNNAARLLARWDSDNKSFVAKMNAAAKKLGMTNSTYTDPSGLQKTTMSTATDQLKLAERVMQDDVFRGIVGMASAQVPGLDSKIYNNNDLLVKQVGVIGLKTGSSTPAGGNLVWAATKTVNGKQQTIYGAVLGQNAGTGKVWDSLQLALSNSQKLIDKVQKGLTSATVVKKGDVVGYVDDQLGGRTPVVATKNMTAVGWPGLKTKLSIGEDGRTVPHTGKAGTTVGVLTVGDGSSHAVKIPVALQKDLAEPGFGAKLTRVS
ncbi:D-alanyl-D-alanine carboxypeptidase [Streptomyces fagopyri]|uniref:D-alanyl-D-alanine carboxypeptidase n=1 Tax=Streptomyces fagopyri TaxID=2662397 RepID=A0A5Q0LFN3_9ACTN|nr:serine hydrolase [Streptomyces fagopyri]QFZ75798.1 D-alanyl-D-alanine carboxypeptidase [Streptomyces fagopyri]